MSCRFLLWERLSEHFFLLSPMEAVSSPCPDRIRSAQTTGRDTNMRHLFGLNLFVETQSSERQNGAAQREDECVVASLLRAVRRVKQKCRWRSRFKRTCELISKHNRWFSSLSLSLCRTLHNVSLLSLSARKAEAVDAQQ